MSAGIKAGPSRLREARIAAGMSQEQLASRIGMDKTTISAIEHGRRKPSLDTLAALAEALGRPAGDLI